VDRLGKLPVSSGNLDVAARGVELGASKGEDLESRRGFGGLCDATGERRCDGFKCHFVLFELLRREQLLVWHRFVVVVVLA
jgi:hypothetical protein